MVSIANSGFSELLKKVIAFLERFRYENHFLNARNGKICFRRFTALELGFHQLVLGAELSLGEDGNIAKIHRKPMKLGSKSMVFSCILC